MAKSFTPEQQLAIAQVIREVWQAIGADAEEVIGADNLGALEMCLDADRPETFCRDKIKAATIMGIVRASFVAHGYIPTLRRINGFVRLV